MSDASLGETLTVVKTGYLMKQARESARNWKKRYFVLNGNTLTYYPDHLKIKTPKGDLLIVGEATISDNPPDRDHRFPFKIVTPFESITLDAESEQDRMEWKIAFIKSIDLVQNSLRGYMMRLSPSPSEPTIRKFFIFYHDTLSVHKDHESTITVQFQLTVSPHTVLEENEPQKEFTVTDRDKRITIQFEKRTENEYIIWVEAFRQTVQRKFTEEQARLRAEEVKGVNARLLAAVAERTIPPLRFAVAEADEKNVRGENYTSAKSLLEALEAEEQAEQARLRAIEEKRVLDLVVQAMESLSIEALTSALNQAKLSNVTGELIDQGHVFLQELIDQRRLKEEAQAADKLKLEALQGFVLDKLRAAISSISIDDLKFALGEAQKLNFEHELVQEAQMLLNDLLSKKAKEDMELAAIVDLLKLAIDSKSIDDLRSALSQAQLKGFNGEYVTFAEKTLQELLDQQELLKTQELKRIEADKLSILESIRIAMGELSIDSLRFALSQAELKCITGEDVDLGKACLLDLLNKLDAEEKLKQAEIEKKRIEEENILKLINLALGSLSIDDLTSALSMADLKFLSGPQIDAARFTLSDLIRKKEEADALAAAELARLEAEKADIIEKIRLAVEAFSIPDLTAILDLARLKNVTGDYVDYGRNYLDYLIEQEKFKLNQERITELIRVAVEALSIPDLTSALEEAKSLGITGEYIDYGQQYLDYLLQQKATEEAEQLHQLELEKFDAIERIRLAIDSNSIADLQAAISHACIKFSSDEYVDYGNRYLVFLNEKKAIEEEGNSVLTAGDAVSSKKSKQQKKANLEGATISGLVRVNLPKLGGWKEMYLALVHSDLLIVSVGADGQPEYVVDRGVIHPDTDVCSTTFSNYSFDIVTPKRTFNIDVSSAALRDDWTRAISSLTSQEGNTSQDTLYRDALALIPLDTFYNIVLADNKALGIVLERAGEWASVKISNFNDTGIRIGSIIHLVDGESVMLNEYQSTIEKLMGRKAAMKIKFRQGPEKFAVLKVQLKGKWKSKALQIGEGYLRIKSTEDPKNPGVSKEYSLLDASVSLASYGEVGKRFCLKVTSANAPLYIQASNVEEMREWGAMLYHAISIANGGAHICQLEKERLAAEEARIKALELQRISAENEDLVRMITKAIDTKNLDSLASLLKQASIRGLEGEFFTFANEFLKKLLEEKEAQRLEQERMLASMAQHENEEEEEVVEHEPEHEVEPEPEPEEEDNHYPPATVEDLAKIYSFYVKHTEFGDYINAMQFSTIWRLVTGVKGNLFKEMQTFNKFDVHNKNGTMCEQDFIQGWLNLAEESGSDEYLRRIRFLLGDDNMLL